MVQQRCDENVKMSRIVSQAKNGYLTEVIASLREGCQVDERDKDNYTALYWSSCNGYPDICKILLKFGSDVSCRFKCGFTCLHASADRGQVDCVKLLIDWSVDVDVQNDRGETALHLACYRGFVPIVKLLLRAGADPFIQNCQKKTALQEAHSQQFDDITNILVRYQSEYQNYHRKSWQKVSDRPKSAPVEKLLLKPNQLGSSKHSSVSSQESFTSSLNIPVNDLSQEDRSNCDDCGVLLNSMLSSPSTSHVPTENEFHSSNMRENQISRDSLEMFADVLQIKYTKAIEENGKLKEQLKKLDLYEIMLQQKIEEEEKLKEAMYTEKEQQKQLVRRFHQQKADLSKQLAESQLKLSQMMFVKSHKPLMEPTHKYLLDIVQASCINKQSCEVFDWSKLKKTVSEIYEPINDLETLDVQGREWKINCDYTVIGDGPINHFGDGQREGSCSLVFRIQHKSKYYVLKMMINLINLYFVNHCEGHSMDSFLHNNFGTEYLIPILLAGHPNIVKVVHHYSGLILDFKKYENLLFPTTLDVPIEMASRTTFLVLPEYPLTFKGFILKQTTCKAHQPLLGLPEIFLLQFFYQLLSALTFLETKDIVHRDIKADNIFMDNCLRPVLGDFGFSRCLMDLSGKPIRFVEKSQIAAGNSHAWAPELCRFSRFDPNALPEPVTLKNIYDKSDGYAMARMIYSILQPPNSTDTFPTSSINCPNYKDSEIPDLPSEMSPHFRNVLKDLVLNHPSERPTMKQAMHRIGTILFEPKTTVIMSLKEMEEYHLSRLLMLAAMEQDQSACEQMDVMTVDESIEANKWNIEAHFLTSITTKEFWDLYSQST